MVGKESNRYRLWAFFNRVLSRLPKQIRLPVQSVVFGLAGGLSAILFIASIYWMFQCLWSWLDSQGTSVFLLGSLATIVVSCLLMGVVLTKVSRTSGGSGIPQLKLSYWKEMGYLPAGPVVSKFFMGIISLAGGISLGSEAPTMYIGGGAASGVAGLMGIHRRKRRRAVVAGAAAGLAAAFNTPLAAISFMLEEIIGDFNSRFLGAVMLASVTGALLVHWLIGANPAFQMEAVGEPSWHLYIAVPVAAVLSSVAGIMFHVYAMKLRNVVNGSKIPVLARPLVGGLSVWAIGSAIYLTYGEIGIFGVGSQTLSAAFVNGLGWRLALVLAIGKLLASILCYGTGCIGGFFFPTLFIGAMFGFFTGGVFGLWLPLGPSDHVILAAVGMSACFASVSKAPVTSVLIVFEMTHQFSMLPALMLGTIISQALSARFAGKLGFDDAALENEGHRLNVSGQSRNLAIWRGIEIGAFCTKNPVVLTEMSTDSAKRVLETTPFSCYPFLPADGKAVVVMRKDLEAYLETGNKPKSEDATVLLSGQTLGNVEELLIQSSTGLFLVKDKLSGPVAGVFTLHDLIRAQADFFDS